MINMSTLVAWHATSRSNYNVYHCSAIKTAISDRLLLATYGETALTMLTPSRTANSNNISNNAALFVRHTYRPVPLQLEEDGLCNHSHVLHL